MTDVPADKAPVRSDSVQCRICKIANYLHFGRQEAAARRLLFAIVARPAEVRRRHQGVGYSAGDCWCRRRSGQRRALVELGLRLIRHRTKGPSIGPVSQFATRGSETFHAPVPLSGSSSLGRELERLHPEWPFQPTSAVRISSTCRL